MSLVLVLENLQWVDADTLLMLHELLLPPAPPLLVVGTVRTGRGPTSEDDPSIKTLQTWLPCQVELHHCLPPDYF